jgi:hypothetical protein
MKRGRNNVATNDKTFEVTADVSLPKISGRFTLNLPADADGDWPRVKYLLACAAAQQAVEVADVKITNVGDPT